jgi:hypothetical protein
MAKQLTVAELIEQLSKFDSARLVSVRGCSCPYMHEATQVVEAQSLSLPWSQDDCEDVVIDHNG